MFHPSPMQNPMPELTGGNREGLPLFRSMKRLLLLLSFLLPGGLLAQDLYHIRELSERDVVQTYTSSLLDACHYGDAYWHDFPPEPGAGYWGDPHTGDHIRNVEEMLMASAALLKYDDALSQKEREEI